MIVSALLLALQLADSATAIHVRSGEARTRVPVVFTRTGAVVEGRPLVTALGGKLAAAASDRATVEIEAVRFEFTAGLPFVRVGSEAAPLAGAPQVRNGVWYFPVEFASEVIPRFVPVFSFDRAEGELRRAVVTGVISPGDVATLSPAGGAGAKVPGAVMPTAAASAATPPVVTPPPAGPPPATSPARAREPQLAPARPVVVVDAGHGGPDRGMSATLSRTRKLYEADLTLAVSKRLRDVLEARGIDVVMTRTTDTLIALADRGAIANRAGARLFLSIHVNAANPRWKNPRSARGFETYFLADAKTEDEQRVAEMENDADRYVEGIDLEPGDPLLFLLNDMKQNEYLRESSLLAQSIQSGLRRVHPGTDRGVKQAGFRVLVAAHMPSVLVEIGFGTNGADAAYMASASGQRALATAIADAALRYIGDYDRRVQAASSQR